MLITVNFMLLCLYSVYSLRKDTVSPKSDVNEYKSRTSDQSSDETKYSKYSRVQSPQNKNSDENEVILSSCSSESKEKYQPIDSRKKKGISKKEEDSDDIYHGTILNSYEETKKMSAETDTARGTYLIEPQIHNNDRTKVRMKFNSDNLYQNKIQSNTNRHGYEDSNNVYHEKIIGPLLNKKSEQNQEEYKNLKKYHSKAYGKHMERQYVQVKNKDIPEKIVNKNRERKDIYQLNENMNLNKITSYVETDRINRRNHIQYAQTKNLGPDIHQKGLQTLHVTPRETRKESVETPNENVDHTRQVSVFYSKLRTQHNDIKNINDYEAGSPDCSLERERQQNPQIIDINLEVPKSPMETTEEEPQRKIDREYVNTTRAADAISNSTIEVSDRDDQEIMAVEEIDDDDEKSTLADYPYSVSIQKKGAHYASGALVGERWVLSTAAEFYNVRETVKLFRMRLGSVDCKKGGLVTPVKSIVIHPSFELGKPSFDVAVLTMAQPVSLSSVVKPIGLSRVGGKVTSAKFLTTYWPRIVVKEVVLPPSAKERVKFNSMRASTQMLVPQEICITEMATVNVTLDKNSLCLKPIEVYHSVCMPDVGAPVVAVDGLWGITSGWVSPLCPTAPLPTVFTRVSAPGLRTWIESQMVL